MFSGFVYLSPEMYVWEAWERWDGAVGMLLWGRLKRPMSLMVGGSSSFVLYSSCAHGVLRHALLVFDFHVLFAFLQPGT